eukprot:scaffold212004_cov36-Tisochrysis_lutea.AAC.2
MVVRTSPALRSSVFSKYITRQSWQNVWPHGNEAGGQNISWQSTQVYPMFVADLRGMSGSATAGGLADDSNPRGPKASRKAAEEGDAAGEPTAPPGCAEHVGRDEDRARSTKSARRRVQHPPSVDVDAKGVQFSCDESLLPPRAQPLHARTRDGGGGECT